GRGVVLGDESAVRDAPLFVCVDVADGAEARVRSASAVERAWLATETRVDVRFDDAREKVVAVERTRYRDLVLDEVTAPVPRGPEADFALAEAARRDPARALGLSDPAVDGFLQR